MYVEKTQVLNNALTYFSGQDVPWEVSIDGDSLIAKWKWMDARFFSPTDINDQTREFYFKVTLNNKGKYRETDYIKDNDKGIDFGSGNASVGASWFKGKSWSKRVTIGFGEDKSTGEAGIIKFKFDTNVIKEPIRKYLTECGYKKAGLFFW